MAIWFQKHVSSIPDRDGNVQISSSHLGPVQYTGSHFTPCSQVIGNFVYCNLVSFNIRDHLSN